MNKVTINHTKSAMLLALSIFSTHAMAEGQTTYFQDVPNEVELLQALGKVSPKIKYRGEKTRSIVFNNDSGNSSSSAGSSSASSSTPEPQQSQPEPEDNNQVASSERETASKPRPQRKHSGGGQKVALGLYFNTNSAELTEKAKGYAESIGKMLAMKQDLTITLSGHTDAVGSDSINVPLSEKRAESVKNYIVSTYKIAPERISIVGKGATETLPNTSPTAPVNRRVEIVSQ
ncbi:MAG: OmpA family protein [Magnetococcus sp. DMHC-1]|nr:OmpA family protein [Magnetococcales bacterium]